MYNGLAMLPFRYPSDDELSDDTIEVIELTAAAGWKSSYLSGNNLFPGTDNQSGYKVNSVSSGIKVEHDYVALQPKLGWVPIDIVRETLECTTQLATYRDVGTLREYKKARYPMLNRRRLMEKYATDTWYASTKDITNFQAHQNHSKRTLVVREVVNLKLGVWIWSYNILTFDNFSDSQTDVIRYPKNG